MWAPLLFPWFRTGHPTFLILESPLPTTGTEVLVQGTIIKATQVSVARDCQEPISCET